PGEAEADEVRQPLLSAGRAVALDAVDRRRGCLDRVGAPGGVGRLDREAVAVEQLGRGGAEPDDGGDVLDAPAPGPLLGAADDERRYPESAAHEERGGALRRAPGVAGDGAEIGAEGGEVDGDVAGGRA